MRNHTNTGPGDAAQAPEGSRRRGNARVARSKGGLSGLMLLLLGAWAGVIPFVGPIFNFGYTPDSSWTWTAARFWYEVLPGAVTVAGAILLIVSASRALTMLGAWAAAVSGAWLVVGPALSPQLGLGSLGVPIDTGWVGALESIGLFYGVGAAILFFASTAIGRLSVKGVRDVRAAEKHAHNDDFERGYERGYEEATPATGGVVRARDPQDNSADREADETRAVNRHDPMVKTDDGSARDASESDDTRDALDVTDGRYTRDARDDERVGSHGRHMS